jgi:hypothetical protein
MPPTTIERGRFEDVAGLVNQIFVCYWRDPSVYVRFAQKSAFARWLAEDDLLTSDVGVWVEAFHIPMTRFETLFSSESPAGAARLTGKPMTGPIDEHGYWGGMRDRIPVSDTHELSSPLQALPVSTARRLGAAAFCSPRPRTSASSAPPKTGCPAGATSATATLATCIQCSQKA